MLQAHIPWGNSNIYWDTGGCCSTGVHRIYKNESDPTKWQRQWNHYVFVKHSNQSRIYQNGVLWHSGTTSAAVGQIVKGYIGSEVNGGNSYNGFIDDSAIFDKPISAAVAASLASGSATPLSLVKPYDEVVLADNPFVYYRFDSDTGANGSTLTDASPNARHGVYQNPVAIDPYGIGTSSAHFNGVDNRAAGTADQPATMALLALGALAMALRRRAS